MQALQQQDFRALVDNHPRAIMLSTTEPRIAYVNRMFRSVTGYQAEEVVGQAPSMLSSGLHSPEFYQAMWKSLSDYGRWEGVIWNRRKNGETYPQWLTIYPVIRDGRQFFAGVFTDVGDIAAGDERLASLAYYDPLTELPNRSLFQEFLKARVAQRERDGGCFWRRSWCLGSWCLCIIKLRDCCRLCLVAFSLFRKRPRLVRLRSLTGAWGLI